MNRCLDERALVRLHMKEGAADEHAHVRLCPRCARRYQDLADDLRLLHAILSETPPLALPVRRLPKMMHAWVPSAALSVVILAITVSVIWMHRPALLPIAVRNGNVSAFAGDVSTAVFADADAEESAELVSDTPYLHAALEAGWPCTSEQLVAGECNDEVSAFFTAVD